MRLFFLELQKIPKNKICMTVLLSALLLNIGLLSATNINQHYTAQNYQTAYQEINTLDDNHKSEFIEKYYQDITFVQTDEYKYSHNFLGELELLDYFRNQWENINSYSEFLSSVKQSAKDSQIAIFKNQSEFQKRNAIKTINDYQTMDGVKLTFTNDQSFQKVIDFSPTDLLALGFIFFVIVGLLVYEKEHKLYFLLKSTKKGRFGLITSKVSVILLITCLSVFMFWGSNLLIGLIMYGSIPLSTSLQSITDFMTSTLNISTCAYLILFFFTKICIYSLLSMIFLYIALKSKKTVEIYFYTFILLGLSIVLYLVIPQNSIFCIFKYINIIPYILVNPIYQSYLNLNIIGFPINVMNIFWIIMMILLPFSIFYNIYIFSKDKTADTLKSLSFKRKKTFKIHVSIFTHECYKLFITQKGFVIILVFMIFSSAFMMNSKHEFSTDEYYYQDYMSILEGTYNQEKQKIVATETRRFEDLHQQSNQAQNDFQTGKIGEKEMNAIQSYVNSQLLSERAFTRVLERVHYVSEHPEYPIIYETGYLELFGKSYTNYKNDFILALFLILTLIILFVPFVANEYSTGMVQLINVQKNGKKAVFRVKLKLCLFITTICFLITYVPQFIMIMQQYGLSNIFISNLAIPELANISLHMPLICQIILLYSIRLLMAYITILLVFMTSQTLKNTYTTLSILCAGITLPLGIGVIGISFINNISLNSLFSSNYIINEFSIVHIIIISALIILFIALYKSKRRNLLKG